MAAHLVSVGRTSFSGYRYRAQLVPADDNIKVLVEGHERVRVDRVESDSEYLRVGVTPISDERVQMDDEQEWMLCCVQSDHLLKNMSI